MTRVILGSRCIDFLLKEHPGFVAYRSHDLRYWKGRPPEGLCNDISAFTSYAQDALKRGDDLELKAIAHTIETIIINGDKQASYAASLCFLEGLTNSCMGEPKRLPFERFARYLGPKSRDFCKELDKFWGTRTPGV